MTSPLLSREEWADLLNSVDNEHVYGYARDYQAVRESLLDSIMSLQSQLTAAREDVERERHVNRLLMAAGNALGNIAYNGAQSDRVPEDYRKSMKEAVTDWDKAREKARQPK